MDYDLVFIGGGPAGYEGAVAAAKRKLKTAVVEMDQLGGTCLQRGCVPTKAILHSVRILKQARESARSGVLVDNPRFNLEDIRKRKDRIVTKHTKGIEQLFKQHGVEWIRGRGRVTARNTVQVDEKTELKAKYIVLATGSKPAELPFLTIDHQRVLCSDDLLKLDEVPASLLVVGAGAVGLEWAVICSHLGTKVTVVEIMDQIVPAGADPEIAAILKNELIKQGIAIHTATAIDKPEFGENVTLNLRQGEKSWQERYTKVLLAVGRVPLGDGLCTDNVAVSRDPKGFVRVDSDLQTNQPGIFAAGDLVGQPLLAHKASHQALTIVDFLVSGVKGRFQPIPAAIFTFPELATVGLTQMEAEKRGLAIKIGLFPFVASPRASTLEERNGLVKIVAGTDDTVLGAQIVGPEAAELMPLLTFAVSRRLKAGDFHDLVFIHPTLSETLWEAMGGIGGFSLHL